MTATSADLSLSSLFEQFYGAAQKKKEANNPGKERINNNNNSLRTTPRREAVASFCMYVLLFYQCV